MAASQENGFLMEASVTDLELQEQGCGCFSTTFRSCFGSRKQDADRVNLLAERQEYRESWVVKQVKKLREVSELVAGPKWKNFIRKIGAYFNTNKKRNDFQYDSFNYTLNFDDGVLDDDQHAANLGFSSRFAPPVLNNKKARSSSS
ncbi:unnamed protein product [Amaranthus hypochondriacus]